MKRSQQVLEWQAEARKEGHEEGREQGQTERSAEAVLEVLQAKFNSVPEDLAGLIRGTTDLTMLKRWLVEAAKADTLDTFRQAAQL